VALLALAGLGLGCASGYKGWSANRTKNITVYTDAKLEHEYIQEWLELSYSAYRGFFPDVELPRVSAVWLKIEPGSLGRFYRPNDDPQAGWTLETVPSRGIGHDGLIVLERKDNYTASPTGFQSSSARDENIAKRQLAYYFINKAVPMAPLWLQIGLGRYMSKFRIHYSGQYWVACFGAVVFDEPVTAGVPDRVTVPLDELLETDWYEYDAKTRRWYEYTAYAFVHFLIQGKNGWHKTRFPILLRALREGHTVDYALRLAYPHILESEWDELLAAHVRPDARRARLAQEKSLPQGMCFRIPPATQAEEKPKRAPVGEAEVKTLLADLERVGIFRRHATWLPQDIVEAEASKRPPERGRGRGAARGEPGAPIPVDEGGIPGLRSSVGTDTPAPAEAAPPPAGEAPAPAPPAPAEPPAQPTPAAPAPPAAPPAGAPAPAPPSPERRPARDAGAAAPGLGLRAGPDAGAPAR
jgi:hypothetical protein